MSRNVEMADVEVSGQSMSCAECEQANASLWCMRCKVPFCESCSSIKHRKAAYKDDVVIKISKVDGSDLGHASFCLDHKTEWLSLLCNQCDTVVCTRCVLFGSHKGHEATELTHAHQERREALRLLLEGGGKDAHTVIERQSSQLEENEKEIRRKAEENRARIAAEVRLLLKSLQKWEKRAYDEISQAEQSKLSENDAMRMQRRTDSLELQRQEQEIRLALEMNEPATLVRKFTDLKTRFEASITTAFGSSLNLSRKTQEGASDWPFLNEPATVTERDASNDSFERGLLDRFVTSSRRPPSGQPNGTAHYTSSSGLIPDTVSPSSVHEPPTAESDLPTQVDVTSRDASSAPLPAEVAPSRTDNGRQKAEANPEAPPRTPESLSVRDVTTTVSAQPSRAQTPPPGSESSSARRANPSDGSRPHPSHSTQNTPPHVTDPGGSYRSFPSTTLRSLPLPVDGPHVPLSPSGRDFTSMPSLSSLSVRSGSHVSLASVPHSAAASVAAVHAAAASGSEVRRKAGTVPHGAAAVSQDLHEPNASSSVTKIDLRSPSRSDPQALQAARERIADLEEKDAIASKELQRLTQEADSLRSQVRELTIRVSDVLSSNKILSDQLDLWRHGINRLNDENDESTGVSVSSLRKDNDKLRRHKDLLEAQIAQMKRDMEYVSLEASFRRLVGNWKAVPGVRHFVVGVDESGKFYFLERGAYETGFPHSHSFHSPKIGQSPSSNRSRATLPPDVFIRRATAHSIPSLNQPASSPSSRSRQSRPKSAAVIESAGDRKQSMHGPKGLPRLYVDIQDDEFHHRSQDPRLDTAGLSSLKSVTSLDPASIFRSTVVFDSSRPMSNTNVFCALDGGPAFVFSTFRVVRVERRA